LNDDTHRSIAKRIAVLLPSLAGGGAERSMLNLIGSFLRNGREVDLLLFRLEGPYLKSVPAGVRVTEIAAGSALRGRWLAARADPSGIGRLLKPVLLPRKADGNLRYVGGLADYLREHQPDVLLSAMTYTNLVALWARNLARVPVPVVVSERISLSHHAQSRSSKNAWRWRHLLPAVDHAYASADGIVAVSNSVARDLAAHTQLEPSAIRTIYNPVVDDSLAELAAEPLDHPWFRADAPPVVLAVGRLIPQKDFPTLLRAFAILSARRRARLVILGEGRLRPELEALARELGIESHLELPGFVENPFRYMSRAAVLALPSIYEGLPGVLIQAMACGCPVVSTDCPGGSSEILDDGQVGPLVPMQNAQTLADALHSALDDPPSGQYLKERAARFSVQQSSRDYLDCLDDIVSAKQNNA
jgi:glycosyltransferase involved in cell wall biosynthesis